MSNRLPYEEQLAQQWNDLPLPDENMAWADMKRRLEKDDDDGIIPFWLRGCGLWGLLAVVVLALGWWFVRPDKWGNKKEKPETTTTINQKEKGNNYNDKINAGDTIQMIKNTGSNKAIDTTKRLSKKSVDDSLLISSNRRQKKLLVKRKDDISIIATNPQPKKRETGSKLQTGYKNYDKNKKVTNWKLPKQTEPEQADISSIQPGIKDKETGNNPVETKNKPVVKLKDSLSVSINTNTSKKDSVYKTSSDTVKKNSKEQTSKTTEQKKDSSKPKKFSFGAGIALHQLIPIDGQKLTPYNSLGRKGSLADYIPSLFGRMYKNNKWFVQLEFRYGAPQSTKEFLYQKKSKTDSAGPQTSFTTTTSSSLKKTFYHQLPVTFNYFVLPNWSIGTGIVWNKFVSAASQQQVIRRNNSTQQDSLLSNVIVKDKNDSIFKKSYLQAVVETQYRWRRFSIGARYAFGIQPYIKFTLPGGTQQSEKNKSLQVFLRYELWKSKAKR